MADNVRFLSGGIGNLDKQPITPGNIYFALSDDKTYGYIVYDFKDSNNSNFFTINILIPTKQVFVLH